MNRNLVGSIYGRSSIGIAHLVLIRWQTWPLQVILISDWLTSNKSSLKPLGQINRHLAGSILGRSSIKIGHFVLNRCYILRFPPGKMSIYWDFPPEKWVYTEISPRKNEYILRFPPGKMSIYWDFPPEKWVYTEFSLPENQVCVNTYSFSPHTSFSPLLF
jgi:hypothetical protein